MRKITKIVGKPGTGKTTYLANDIIDKIENGNSLNDILFTSFSRSAMRAMFDKFNDRGIDKKACANFGTIYRLANKTLGYSNENYIRLDDFKCFSFNNSLDFDARAQSIKKIENLDEFGISGDNAVFVEGNVLFNWWQYLKLVFITNDMVRKMMRTYYKLNDRQQEAIRKRDIEQILFLFDEWESYKQKKDRWEYVDLLQKCFIEERPYINPFKFAYIDEAHDFGPLQMELFEFWCSQPYVLEEKICFDELQTIYTFTGSDPNIVKNIKADENITLPKSYRVPQIPWAFAKKVAQSLNDSSMENIQASEKQGDVLFSPLDKTIAYVINDKRKTFFLFRTNSGVDEFLSYCFKKRIPIRGLGRTQTIFQGKYFSDVYNLLIKLSSNIPPTREEVRSLLMSMPATYLMHGRKQDFSKRRYIYWGNDEPNKEKLFDDKLSMFYNIFKEKIDDVSGIKEIIAYPNFKLKCKDYLLATNSKDILFDNIELYAGTYHSSKGLEADNVVLQDYHLEKDWRIDEESRIGYVGITRTKDNLFITLDPMGDDFLASFY